MVSTIASRALFFIARVRFLTRALFGFRALFAFRVMLAFWTQFGIRALFFGSPLNSS